MEVDSDSDYSENAPPARKPAAKPKAARAKKADPGEVLQPSQAANSEAGGGRGRAIEDIYQKKTPLEHILLRPDTYIGSTEKQQQKMWVHDGEALRFREVDFVPGLYKIFDEILVNAADNKVRDPKMNLLEVTIDQEANLIVVRNNGDGVPVEVHKEEGVYVPELIFGHLLTSSNYDDTQKKVTGGRNGYGAKLANIFSSEFVIETADGKRGRRYRQVFRANMSVKEEPVIKPCPAKENWTSVSFRPDLPKFGMERLEDDTFQLMSKRVYDLAGVLGKGVKVHLNGRLLPVRSFAEYVDLYLEDKSTPRVHERVNDRWEVIAMASPGQFQQVSFVNSICTVKGGTHVNHVVDQITKGLLEALNKSKEHKKANIKPFMVKNHLSVFINCMIENPAFDSQTKETLTLKAASFGSRCDLPDKFLKRLGGECGVGEAVASFADFKNSRELKKSDGSAKRTRILGNPKLMDAFQAGKRQSADCTLILTEGDSAKSLVVGGLSVVGQDLFGVFPLRGKLLNVRDASMTQITGNAEIQAIKQIMGLQHGKVYTDAKQLRYGHLMIMTDQDHDGSHIKGLIMNFFHHFYPSLLKLPGFLLEFITPIVKASKGRQTLAFYTMPEYEAWAESVNTAGWRIKYYKGLGTSTQEEAQEYFADIGRHRKAFVWGGEGDADCLELAFSKKKADARKAWLSGYEAGTYLDQSVQEISYSDFVNKELILFSRADLERSIPSMVDGLKPGQRKILFACFKKGLKADIKVAQLSGYVSEHSAYHHGETSLQSTIVNLAQSFVGSNNINLLVPSGQFGTRLQGGKDAASARYIFTRLEPITRTIFHDADDRLLAYLSEEGQSIEPQWYMPVLPMVLVNGAEGIGTGWSTSIPNFNPRDIVANLRRLLAGEAPQPMQPWYRNFRGTIAEVAPARGASGTAKSYACNGAISKASETELHVTELPIRKWTQDYKEYLEGLIKPEGAAGAGALLADYKELHSMTHVHFELQALPGAVPEEAPEQLLAKFKLTSRLTLSNMVLFDKDGVVKRYASPEAILEEFLHLRLDFYGRRRLLLIQTAEEELRRISNRVRFILAVISGELRVSNRPRRDIEADMDAMGFERVQPPRKAKVVAVAAAAVDGEGEGGEGEGEETPAGASFDYLLSMPIHSLTLEKVRALQAEQGERTAAVAALRATTPEQLYAGDLDAFLAALQAFEDADAANQAQLEERRRRAAGGKGRGGKKAAAKPRKPARADSDDSGAEDWSDGDCAPKAKPAARKPAAKASASSSSGASGSQGTAAAAPAAKPKAAAKPKPKAAPAPQPAPPAAEELSLMDRLAGRLGSLTVQPEDAAAAAAAPPAPALAAAPKPRRAAAKKQAPVVLSESEEESEAEDWQGSDSESEAEAPRKAPAKKAAAPKRKPATAKEPARPAAAAVSRLQQAAGASAESPVIAPQGKVRRMRPSPFHKGSGAGKEVAAAPAARKPGAAAMQPVSEEAASEGEEVEMVQAPAPTAAAARPSRRAAVARKNYTEDLASSSEASEASEGEAESDFEPSD